MSHSRLVTSAVMYCEGLFC